MPTLSYDAQAPGTPGRYSVSHECKVLVKADVARSDGTTETRTELLGARLVLEFFVTEGPPAPASLTLDPDSGPHSTVLRATGMQFSTNLVLNEVRFVRAEADGRSILAAVTNLDPVLGLRVTVPPVSAADLRFPGDIPGSATEGLIDPRSPAVEIDEYFVAVDPVPVDVTADVDPAGPQPQSGTATFGYRPTRIGKTLWLDSHAALATIVPGACCLSGNKLYFVDRQGTNQRLRVLEMQPGIAPQPMTLATWNVLIEGAAALAIDGTTLYVALNPSIGVSRRIASVQVDAQSPSLVTVVQQTAGFPILYGGLAVAGNSIYFTDVGRDFVGVVNLTDASPQEAVFAGVPFSKGNQDGSAADARFDTPTAVVHRAGRLLVGDANGIRDIEIATGTVATAKLGDGTVLPPPAPTDPSSLGNALAVDADGNLFIARGGNGVTWARPDGAGWSGFEALDAYLPSQSTFSGEGLLTDDRGALHVIGAAGTFLRIAME